MLKTEANQISEKIVNKLIAYGSLEMSHKNIWRDEIIEWLAENPEYSIVAHSKLNLLYFDTKDGIQPLLNTMLNLCIDEPKMVERKDITGQSACEWDSLKEFKAKVDFIDGHIKQQCTNLSTATCFVIRKWMGTTGKFTSVQILKVRRHQG